MKLSHRNLPLWMLLLIPTTVLLTSYADGPPPSRTGAPGELTCFNGYCHNSFQLNSGLGTISLAGSEALRFIPGQIYTLDLSVVDSGMAAFGFSVSARYADNGEPAGSWQTTSGNQVTEENGRTYIMHDTVKVSSNSASWPLSWLPPDSLTGPVELYVAAVAANANGNRSGDFVYTYKTTISPDSISSSLSDLASRLSWVQAGNKLRIDLPDPNSIAKVLIWDLQGRELSNQILRGNRAEIDVTSWPRQIYLVKVEQGGKKLGGKIQLR